MVRHVRLNGQDRRVQWTEWLLEHDPAKNVYRDNLLAWRRARGAGIVTDTQFGWADKWLRASATARCRRAGIELPR